MHEQRIVLQKKLQTESDFLTFGTVNLHIYVSAYMWIYGYRVVIKKGKEKRLILNRYTNMDTRNTGGTVPSAHFPTVGVKITEKKKICIIIEFNSTADVNVSANENYSC